MDECVSFSCISQSNQLKSRNLEEAREKMQARDHAAVGAKLSICSFSFVLREYKRGYRRYFIFNNWLMAERWVVGSDELCLEMSFNVA